MSNSKLKGADENMEKKKVIFSQSDFMYTVLGASVLTGILVVFTQI